jgi:hypothetical protein
MFSTSQMRLVRVKAKEGEIDECDIELEGRSILEHSEKKKTGTKKRKNDDQEEEDSETPAEAFSEAALAFKRDNNGQLPEPPTCLDPFNRTVYHDMSVPISSAKFDNGQKTGMPVRDFYANGLDTVDNFSTSDDQPAWVCQNRPESPSLTRDSEGTVFKPEITPIRTITRLGRIYAFDRYVAGLKRRALLAQRPHKPELICCDYEACDKASDLGLPYTICQMFGGGVQGNARSRPSVPRNQSI